MHSRLWAVLLPAQCAGWAKYGGFDRQKSSSVGDKDEGFLWTSFEAERSFQAEVACNCRAARAAASPAGMPDLVSSCPGRSETLSPPIFPNLIASSDAGLPQRAFHDNERRVGGMPEQLSLSYFHFSSTSTRVSDWLLSRSGGWEGAYEKGLTKMLNSPRLLLFSLLRRVSSHSARWQDLKSGLLCDFLCDWQPRIARSPSLFFIFLFLTLFLYSVLNLTKHPWSKPVFLQKFWSLATPRRDGSGSFYRLFECCF